MTRGMRAIRFLCISGEWVRDKGHLHAEILLQASLHYLTPAGKT
ncbi:MAG TPA: hypothetical protein VN695_04995 [Streptosporangiaceae bacterium]|nr:hypothetical protein [Streptosporangiaceae bacterium]